MPQGLDNRGNPIASSFDDVSAVTPYLSIDDSSVHGAFLDNENNYELQQGPKDLPLTGAISGDAISFLSSTLPYKKEGSSDTNFPHLSGSTPSLLEQSPDFESNRINRDYIDGIVNNTPINNVPSEFADPNVPPEFDLDNPENLLSLENLTPPEIETENIPEIANPLLTTDKETMTQVPTNPLITDTTIQPDIVEPLNIPENIANESPDLNFTGNVPDTAQNLENYIPQDNPNMNVVPETVLQLQNRADNEQITLDQNILPDTAPNIMLEPETVLNSNVLVESEPQLPTIDMQPPLSGVDNEGMGQPDVVPPTAINEQPVPDIQPELNNVEPNVSVPENISNVIKPETQASIMSQPVTQPVSLANNDITRQETLESYGVSNLENINTDFNSQVGKENTLYNPQRPQQQESLNNLSATTISSETMNKTFNDIPESATSPSENFSPDKIVTSSGETLSGTDAKEIKQLVSQNMVNDDIKGYVSEQLDKYIGGLTVDLLGQMTDLAQTTSETTLNKACEGI